MNEDKYEQYQDEQDKLIIARSKAGLTLLEIVAELDSPVDIVYKVLYTWSLLQDDDYPDMGPFRVICSDEIMCECRYKDVASDISDFIAWAGNENDAVLDKDGNIWHRPNPVISYEHADGTTGGVLVLNRE